MDHREHWSNIDWLIISFVADEVAKEFWAKQLPILIAKFSEQASTEFEQSEDCQLRVAKYKDEYQQKVDEMIHK